MKMTLSATLRAKSISCVTTIMVLSPDFSPLMTFSTSPVSSGSSAEVGSSKHRMSGESASARAIAMRCCCPPESSHGYAFARSPSPTRSRSACARLSMSPKRRSRTAVFFAAVTSSNSMSFARCEALSCFFAAFNSCFVSLPSFSSAASSAFCEAVRAALSRRLSASIAAHSLRLFSLPRSSAASLMLVMAL